jgi:hypothetical protein
MKRLILAALLLSQLVCASEEPLMMEWNSSISNGVQRVDCFDLDAKGGQETYAMSYNTKGITIYAYDASGTLQLETMATRAGGQEAGSEESLTAAVADLDRDQFLDILLNTKVQASGIRNHPLYRLQRVPEEGLNRFYNRYVWKVMDTGMVTSLTFVDVNGDGKDEILTSSVDDRIRAYDENGLDLLNITLNSSLWDVAPVRFGDPAAYNDSEVNASDGITRTMYLAAGFQGLYFVDYAGRQTWYKPSDSKFEKVASMDLDGDWSPELMGVSGGVIYVFDRRGNLLWQHASADTAAMGFLRIPGVNETYVVVAADRKITLLDETGNVTWETGLPSRALSLRICGEGGQKIIVGAEDGIYAYGVGMGFFKGESASATYDRALAAFADEEFNISASLAREAATLYFDLGDEENALKSSDLRSKAEKLADAKSLYQLAEEHYAAGRYNQSMFYAKMAQDAYLRLGYSKGANQSGELGGKGVGKVDRMIEVVGSRRTADGYYSQAETYYVNSSYELAHKYALMAMDEYRKINNTQGIKLAGNLASMSEKFISSSTAPAASHPPSTGALKPNPKVQTYDWATYGIIAAAVLILAFGVVSWRRSKG